MSITHFPVEVQTSPQEIPSLPAWFGEVVLVASYLKQQGVLEAINQQVRQDGRRMGHYQPIDFLALLIGYALSGEATLQSFCERLAPFAAPFMALFGRDQMPARSTLSRFLSSLSAEGVESLRRLFQQDLFARPLPGAQQAGLWDRAGRQWSLFDVDGTRAVARQRALPHLPELPQPQRRMEQVCAKGYGGRKRGEVVRTRTVITHAFTHQWLGTFAGAGNGDYREELRRGLQVITAYLGSQQLTLSQALVRLDGLYGTGTGVEQLHLAGLGWVMRGKDYALLNCQQVQERLPQPPDTETQHPETGTCRQLFDFPALTLTPSGPPCRVIVAAHRASASPAAVGKTVQGEVYELFYTNLPQDGFLPADILDCYFGRGGFETVLADEDCEQATDRWCSHQPAGQSCWQIICQWVWNLRLELGQQGQPSQLRTTQLAPAHACGGEPALLQATPPPALPEPPAAPSPPALDQPAALPPAFLLAGYEPPRCAAPARAGLYAAHDFAPQPDGTLLCPNQQTLRVRARYRQATGDLRVFYAASTKSCAACPLRAACLREGDKTAGPRQVSLLYPRRDPVPPAALAPSTPLLPVPVGPFPLLWRDQPRCQTRRQWISLLRRQTVTLTPLAGAPEAVCALSASQPVLTRAQRKHWRLSWAQRLARNAAPAHAPRVRLHLFGIPPALAALVGVAAGD